MEDSWLNQAHFNGRRADKHLQHGRFDEAIECHQKSADLLQKLIQRVTVPISLESLKLQHDFQIKCMELVRLKKEHYRKFLKRLNQQMPMKHIPWDKTNVERMTNACNIQIEIYKNMADTDSLLEQLGGQEHTMKLVSSDSAVVSIQEQETRYKSLAHDLTITNFDLKSLISTLIVYMDETNREVTDLTEKLKSQTQPSADNNDNDTKIMTGLNRFDINRLNTLTLMSSSCEELMPNDDEDSVDLPPLELPTFDFSTFETK